MRFLTGLIVLALALPIPAAAQATPAEARKKLSQLASGSRLQVQPMSIGGRPAWRGSWTRDRVDYVAVVSSSGDLISRMDEVPRERVPAAISAALGRFAARAKVSKSVLMIYRAAEVIDPPKGGVKPEETKGRPTKKAAEISYFANGGRAPNESKAVIRAVGAKDVPAGLLPEAKRALKSGKISWKQVAVVRYHVDVNDRVLILMPDGKLAGGDDDDGLDSSVRESVEELESDEEDEEDDEAEEAAGR